MATTICWFVALECAPGHRAGLRGQDPTAGLNLAPIGGPDKPEEVEVDEDGQHGAAQRQPGLDQR